MRRVMEAAHSEESMRVGLTDYEQVKEMIESRKWWILVGTHQVYDELEAKFYPNSEQDDSFITIVSPPAFGFERYLEGIMVLHFARKDKLSQFDMLKFFNSHPDHKAYPPVMATEKQDIIWIECNSLN